MDWNDLRSRWRAAGPPSRVGALLERIGPRSDRLRAAISRRDFIESAIAIVLFPAFAWLAWQLASRGTWLPFAFVAFLLGWLVYVPLRLRAARRALPTMRADLPTRDYLAAERDAMRAQATMLEQVWRWYLAPCAIGVCGFVLSARGFTLKTIVYSAVVLAFCFLLGHANRVAARTQFRALADDIDRQIRSFEEDRP
jgi:hypothetical protein